MPEMIQESATGRMHEKSVFCRVDLAQHSLRPTGVIERQENLKPQSPMEIGLVDKDQARSSTLHESLLFNRAKWIFIATLSFDNPPSLLFSAKTVHFLLCSIAS
jgi:hypothetical protein